MLKRLVYLLFGIDGVIDIETKPEIKLVVIHWRIKRKDSWQGNPTIGNSLVPDDWRCLLITERW